MLPTAVEIKEKLLKALDDKNDVDDATVLEMVTILERYPITRATLEETRIGKMVNDLRRKIKNEKLAKRVKQLVRNWKKILDQSAPVNGSPGLVHPSIAQLQSSPAVSPALSPSPSMGHLASPAQARSKPNTPTMGAQRNASPALLAKGGASAGRKGISPAMTSRPVTPTAVHTQSLASPALSTGRPRASLAPGASGRKVSPGMPSRAVSPAVSGRVSSPSINSRVASPALGQSSGQPSPLAATSPPIQSAAMLSSKPGRKDELGGRNGRQRSKGKGSAAEHFACSGRVTPVSVHSENSQDRVLGEGGNGQHDSDSDSPSNSTRAGQSRYPHNHSTGVTFTNSNKNYGKDQRELSKTNVANRKRTRDKSDSPPDEAHKKSRLDSSSLSGHSSKQEKVVNGCVSKSSKKGSHGIEIPRVSSTSSLPASAYKPVTSPSMVSTDVHPFLSHSQSESLFRQESTDSRLSAQSLERPSRDKHKVKTTEQLIEELQKKNNSSNVGNTIMTKLRTNQIEKESDLPGSSLPAGVKPRGKRGRRGKNQDINLSVPSSDAMLSQTKNELVERFLQTSDPSSPVEEYSPFKEDLLSDPSRAALEPKLELGSCSSSYSKDNFDSSFSASRQDRSESAPKDENSMDAVSPAGPSTSQSERTGSALTLQEIYAQLPPIDNDIDWDAVDFYELPEPAPVTEERVNSLHTERLPGVNGVYDINGDWCSWKEMVTLPAYEGNQLHILPYVDLDG